MPSRLVRPAPVAASTLALALVATALLLTPAAGPGGLQVTGHFTTATRTAVRRYQQAVLGRATGVVATRTWHALHGGLR